MFARMGIALRGDLQRDGATVTVTGQSGEIVLPFDAGVLSWQATDTVMTETGDGAVEIDLTAPQTVTVATLRKRSPCPRAKCLPGAMSFRALLSAIRKQKMDTPAQMRKAVLPNVN